MDFKSLRDDKLHYTQEEMAKIAGVSVEKIKEWDVTNDPSFIAIQAIMDNTGLGFNDITGYKKPEPKVFEAKDTWKKTSFTRKNLIDYLRNALDKYDLSEEYKTKYIADLAESVDNTLVKPSISIVGRSDTGKSTMTNALLGTDKMPTSWTPTTSIAVYIKHISDRPEYIHEDAWVFADHVGNEQLWDVTRLKDAEYCKKWKITGGPVEVLREFGTRQGSMYSRRAGAAVVFVDAPILKNCDIVDLPGFGTETESDDLITMKAAQRTDILIYLSQANGFMRIEDITYLKENVRNLPVWEANAVNKLKPLSNLFVVASQAHTINNGNRADLMNILRTGWENFSKTLAPNYWDKRKKESGYSIDFNSSALPRRFFTYTTDIPSLCKQFNDELQLITELLPGIIEENTKSIIKKFVASRIPSLEAEIKHYEDIRDERDKYKGLLDEIDQNELKRTKETNDRRSAVLDLINTLSLSSRDEFSAYCAKTINVDSIAEMIKKKGVKNKKGDIEIFVSQLQDTLREKCDSILEEKSKELSERTKNYISQFNNDIGAAFNKSNIDVDFDAGYAFVSALSKLGIVGGLGAYLAGEAAFLFGSWSFIMGLGGNIAFMASAFGPIGIALGLAISGIIGLVVLFGGGWEKSVAKRLVKGFEDIKVVDQYRDGIAKYWEETETAFNKAAELLDEEWNKYVDTLKTTVNNDEVEEIDNNITMLKKIKSFFKNIPL